MSRKLWGGAFREETGKALAKLSVSIGFDRRLHREDIAGTRAHARTLRAARLLSAGDLRKIDRALDVIEKEIAAGKFPWREADEDVHLNLERRLIEIAGVAGERIHAGRSRNDQVALDLRLHVLGSIGDVDSRVHALAAALVGLASRTTDVIVPAYTHLRRAQPILLAHAVLAHVEPLRRDRERLADARRRTAISPLGSGACAGTTLRLDRTIAARALGLRGITLNSLDAVADRDFVVETEAALALLMAHLSRLSEDLVLWTSDEFAFLQLSDRSTTGSSMMPQKKNPDAFELVRGKSGRVFGHLLAMLTVLKGLPLAYNRDLQEDKEGLFDALDTVRLALDAMREAVEGLRVRSGPVDLGGGLNATDFAEYLVRRGVPFRRAHRQVGELVAVARKRGVELQSLTLAELRAAAPRVGPDVFRALDPVRAVAARDVAGGTAPRRVRSAIREVQRYLKRTRPKRR
ncbi:MAG: argininosuccinate lyase [Planctomycetes bacterium]|nr:argininosuccinate lyase [Planctomycetota bacterium]MBI3848337.1 argininosuccinate lyase [Planctomycetota bacterium]